MSGRKARKVLEEKKRHLEEQLTNLEKQTAEMGLQIKKATRKTITVPGFGRVVVAHDDQRLLRDYDDAIRAQGRIALEIAEVKFLLNPGIGRGEEIIYRQALQDRAANPQLSVRLLAKKYFPDYFPNRADSAVRKMDQGLRRLTRKKTSR